MTNIFHNIYEKLADSYACYSLSIQEHYFKIVQTFDVQFFFIEDYKPIPKPKLKLGDTLYLFQIPVTEGMGPNYLGSCLFQLDIRGVDQGVTDRSNRL